jgi:hypothetical protein
MIVPPLCVAPASSGATPGSPDLLSPSGMVFVTGWGLVRTHAAGAACVLPRPATPRPLGATLLAAAAPPDVGLLGATASRIPGTEGARAVS